MRVVADWASLLLHHAQEMAPVMLVGYLRKVPLVAEWSIAVDQEMLLSHAPGRDCLATDLVAAMTRWTMRLRWMAFYLFRLC